MINPYSDGAAKAIAEFIEVVRDVIRESDFSFPRVSLEGTVDWVDEGSASPFKPGYFLIGAVAVGSRFTPAAELFTDSQENLLALGGVAFTVTTIALDWHRTDI